MISATDFVTTALAFRRHPTASAAELKTFQDAQLRRLVCHAYDAVPFYRKLFDRHRLHPRHIRGTVDLELIPIITKQELQDLPPSKLVARGVDQSTLLAVRTNGSTGEPFVVRRTWLEAGVRTLLHHRSLQEYGIKWTDRVAVVGSPRAVDPKNKKLPGYVVRALGVNPQTRINGLEEPSAIVRQLDELRPDVLHGLPGMLCRVADYLGSVGRDDIRPRVLSVGGEVLTPMMRRRLTDAFGVSPVQTYASHEFPLMGWECRTTGGIHTCDDAVILEVLRDGRHAHPGEDGEVVVTNLHAYAMPLIRYRLADVVTRGPAHCACGQPFSVISAIRGRMSDYFTLSNGRLVHPYVILESFMPGTDAWIRQYQMIQDRLDRIVLRLVPRETPPAGTREMITRAVMPLLGPGIEFEVSLVNDIPLDSGGKFRHARSLVSSPYDCALM
jgi:phenylacetate-CoA ligase